MAQIHQGGRPLVSPPRFKPKRDRRIDVRSIVCPTCEAAVGLPCMSSKGTVVQHVARRRAVIRRENEARDAAQ